MQLKNGHIQQCDLGCNAENSRTEKGFIVLNEGIISQRPTGRVPELDHNCGNFAAQPETSTAHILVGEQEAPLGGARGALPSSPTQVNQGCECSLFAALSSGNASLLPSAQSPSSNTLFSNQCRYPKCSTGLSVHLVDNVTAHQFPPGYHQNNVRWEDMLSWSQGWVQSDAPASYQSSQDGNPTLASPIEETAAPLGTIDCPERFSIESSRRELFQPKQDAEHVLHSSSNIADEPPSFDHMMAKVLESISGQLLALLQKELDKDEYEVESE